MRFIILEEKPNPSTDYFVLPWVREKIAPIGRAGQVSKREDSSSAMAGIDKISGTRYGGVDDITTTVAHIPTVTALPAPEIHRISWDQDIAPQLLDGAFVVIVRYLTSNWRKTLEPRRDRLHSLAYFFDDDIPDISAGKGLPLKYRFKLYRHGARHFNWLIRQDVQLLVSTPYLQTKYGAHNPTLLKPRQLLLQTPKEHQEVKTQSPQTKKRCLVFYHATASHRKEIEWLYPVMKEVLDTCPSIEFEIVGDAKTLALYKNLPRTTVVDPMSWKEYQKFIALPGRDIGLAPHLDNPFNRARSYTKLFDIERAGAVGVVADSGPWADETSQQNLQSALGPDYLSRHVMVSMQQDSWVEAMLQLAAKQLTE